MNATPLTVLVVGATGSIGRLVSRRQIAQVLVASLTSSAAAGKTFELAAEQGPAQADLDRLFDALRPDARDSVDAVLDVENMPMDGEPAAVRQQLLDIRDRWRK